MVNKRISTLNFLELLKEAEQRDLSWFLSGLQNVNSIRIQLSFARHEIRMDLGLFLFQNIKKFCLSKIMRKKFFKNLSSYNHIWASWSQYCAFISQAFELNNQGLNSPLKLMPAYLKGFWTGRPFWKSI